MFVHGKWQQGHGNQGDGPKFDAGHKHLNAREKGVHNDRKSQQQICQDYGDIAHPQLADALPHSRERIDAVLNNAVRQIHGGSSRSQEAQLLKADENHMGNTIGAIHPVLDQKYEKSNLQHLLQQKLYRKRKNIICPNRQ